MCSETVSPLTAHARFLLNRSWCHKCIAFWLHNHANIFNISFSTLSNIFSYIKCISFMLSDFKSNKLFQEMQLMSANDKYEIYSHILQDWRFLLKLSEQFSDLSVLKQCLQNEKKETSGKCQSAAKSLNAIKWNSNMNKNSV